MEEDAEAVRAVDWDRSAADAAYRAEVERAQERARLVRPQPGPRRPTLLNGDHAGWSGQARNPVSWRKAEK